MFGVNDACRANTLDRRTETPQSIHFLKRDVVWHDDCCLYGTGQGIGLSRYLIARTRIIPTERFMNR